MKRITVKVKAGARRTDIQALGESSFIVTVQAPAEDGRANKAVIEVLAEHFDLRKSCFSIVKGEHHSEKVIQIDE